MIRVLHRKDSSAWVQGGLHILLMLIFLWTHPGRADAPVSLGLRTPFLTSSTDPPIPIDIGGDAITDFLVVGGAVLQCSTILSDSPSSSALHLLTRKGTEAASKRWTGTKLV